MADDLQLENEVLEFDDDALPELPEDNPFETERSKKPWFLVMLGVVAVTLVAVVVVKLFVGTGGTETGLIEIPIDTAETAIAPKTDSKDIAPDAEKPVGMPERVIGERPSVVFDPDKPVVQRPRPRPAEAAGAPVAQTAPKTGTWSVQVGSYASRAAAEAGQRQMQSSYRSLFSGRNFAILAAVMPNGQTMYRLRVVGFQTSGAANGFCEQAQGSNLDCYVTK